MTAGELSIGIFGVALVLNVYDKYSVCPRKKKNIWLCLKKYNSFFPQLEMRERERKSVATVVLSLLLVIKVIGS